MTSPSQRTTAPASRIAGVSPVRLAGTQGCRRRSRRAPCRSHRRRLPLPLQPSLEHGLYACIPLRVRLTRRLCSGDGLACAPGDECAGEVEEGVAGRGASFVGDLRSAEEHEPGEGAFDDPAACSRAFWCRALPRAPPAAATGSRSCSRTRFEARPPSAATDSTWATAATHPRALPALGWGSATASPSSSTPAPAPPASSAGPARRQTPAQHVSVHTRGLAPNSADEQFSIGSTTTIPRLTTGRPLQARITYRPGQLTVTLMGKETLSVLLDLATRLSIPRGLAWLGFTAATVSGARFGFGV
jgi:hypothetical protein